MPHPILRCLYKVPPPSHSSLLPLWYALRKRLPAGNTFSNPGDNFRALPPSLIPRQSGLIGTCGPLMVTSSTEAITVTLRSCSTGRSYRPEEEKYHSRLYKTNSGVLTNSIGGDRGTPTFPVGHPSYISSGKNHLAHQPCFADLSIANSDYHTAYVNRLTKTTISHPEACSVVFFPLPPYIQFPGS